MARSKRVHKTSPKTPSRIKKRRGKGKGKGRSRAHHHPELIGLGLAGLGVFLAAVLWFGFSGGPVGHLVRSGVGVAAYLAPLVLIPLGALMVATNVVNNALEVELDEYLQPYRKGARQTATAAAKQA